MVKTEDATPCCLRKNKESVGEIAVKLLREPFFLSAKSDRLDLTDALDPCCCERGSGIFFLFTWCCPT